MPEYSGCLVENPTCNFAVSFGFSYLCEHPEHKYFHVKSANSTRHLDHNEIYKNLKEKRKKEYISKAKRYLEDLA